MTAYALQLREKQKIKHYYGVLERQFRGYFKRAERTRGNTGDALMSLLERRLDNVVHRLGWGNSRAQARQLISHGHVTINGGKVDVPSYQLRTTDVIRVKNRPKSLQAVLGNTAENQHEVPDYLSATGDSVPEGRMVRVPQFEDVSIPVQIQLVIELCSK